MAEPHPVETPPRPEADPGKRKLKKAWQAAWERGRGKLLAVLILVAFVLGYALAPRHRAAPSATAAPSEPSQKAPEAAGEHIRYWTCSMHPQIKLPQKGKCPICFMDLVPVMERAGGEEGEGARLVLSRRARELAEVETGPVEYRPLAVTVRMVGKMDYDETSLANIAAWVGGRIDRLFVDYAGMHVNKGDHLVSIYSPDLRTGQEEYLIALRRWQTAKKGSDADELASAEAIKTASRKKLELWGVLPAQVDELEKTGRTDDHVTIYAPIGGTVIERDAFVGKYVQMGERLFTIADLGTVWAVLDAYEIDLGWVHYGQNVEFETDAYPGEVFKGRIAFVYPLLNEMTRTVKVRVNVPNPEGKLKPGLYIRAKLDVTLDDAGHVMNETVAGKWMCPMHPEIVKDKPSTCDKCGMDLVETEKLGFSHPNAPVKKVLSIPATAPLLTGKRAVVYVEERKGDEVAYVGREVELGPRAGDYYIVKSGLNEGERVVTRGSFKIDSALQIMAKPSMMKPTEAKKEEAPPQFASPADMPPALEAYLALADALAADDAAKAAGAVVSLKSALAKADGKGLTGEAHHKFTSLVEALRKAVPADVPGDLAGQRKLLGALAKPLGDYLRAFSHGLNAPIFEAFCPMAFDNKGGTWFQKGNDIRNPYFGAAMLKCGEAKRELKPAASGGGK